MKAAVVFVVCLFALAFASSNDYHFDRHIRREFMNFALSNARTYESSDFAERFEVFRSNYLYIEEHNSRNTGYTLGINQFADMTDDEFRASFLGANYNHTEAMEEAELFEATETTDVAASCPAGSIAPGSACDWRAANALTPVKNQAKCGSCWAFSTTGALESAWFLNKGQLLSLSEQNLVDCSKLYLNMGCNGGLPTRAFAYIKSHGINSEEQYPYEAKDGKCRFDSSKVVATVKGHISLARKGEKALETALQTVGPVTVAIDAGQSSFRFYKTGVYYEPACSSVRLNHAVVAIGYGSTESKDYFIVRNSWATTWGDEGHILMARNKNNNCGIASQPAYPVL